MVIMVEMVIMVMMAMMIKMVIMVKMAMVVKIIIMVAMDIIVVRIVRDMDEFCGYNFNLYNILNLSVLLFHVDIFTS